MKKIDLEKLERIPIEEVPIRKETKWDSVFSSIPAGEALVVPKDAINPVSVRQALKRRQKRGELPNYSMATRGENTYIIHGHPQR